MEFSHYSVMLEECLEGLHINPEGVYVDGTAGGAGHSSQIAKRLTTGRLLALDQDPDAVAIATERLSQYPCAQVVRINFRNMGTALANAGVSGADGVLLDLGVSSHQLDTAERGFSYLKDAPLDMRMSQEGPSAADLVASSSEEEIARILWEYGEERYSRSIARAIVRERENAGPFRDIFDFCRRIDTADCNKRVTESLIKAGAFDDMGANRPQMLAVYEAAMDANQAQKKKNVSGQVSLFDMFGGGEAQPLFDAELKLPDLPDCPARVKLNMEKEASGVYMTGHPLDDYRNVLKSLSFTAAEITEPDEEMEGPDLDGVFADLGVRPSKISGNY